MFLALLWKELGLPKPTPVQLEIASWLQHGPARRGVLAFRGVGKSWITSAYVIWRLWNDRSLRCLVLSASKDRSDAFSTFTKRLLNQISFLRDMAPVPPDDRDSNIMFDVHGAPPSHAASVKSIGIYGQVTGSRAGLVICDDVEVPNNSETPLQREKLIRRVAELGGAVVLPEDEGGEVVFLGTAQTEDSLYTHLPEKGYTLRVWPAEMPAEPSRYLGRLAPSVQAAIDAGVTPGTPFEPTRFGIEELTRRRVEYGGAGYALQFMLDTTLSDADRYPLKLSDFIVLDIDDEMAPEKLAWGAAPEQRVDLPNVGFQGDAWFRAAFVAKDRMPYELSVMYVDPSGRGADETAYAIIKTLHGFAYLAEWGGYTDGYAAPTLRALAHKARHHKVKHFVAEDNYGDGMWLELMKPVLNGIYPDGCKVEGEPVRGKKEERIIERVGPVLGAHKLVISPDCIRRDVRIEEGRALDSIHYSGLHQLTRITREKGSLRHDDRLEALAGALNLVQRLVARDTDKSLAVSKDAAFQAELRKFEEMFKGKHARPEAKVWSDRI